MVLQHRIDESAIAGQFCRDRGMRAGSENAVAQPRRERRDHLALAQAPDDANKKSLQTGIERLEQGKDMNQ